jgi:hypothetical protein
MLHVISYPEMHYKRKHETNKSIMILIRTTPSSKLAYLILLNPAYGYIAIVLDTLQVAAAATHHAILRTFPYNYFTKLTYLLDLAYYVLRLWIQRKLHHQ